MTDDELIPRAPGDDVVAVIRFRRSSFEALTSTPDGRSVPVSAGSIGLVADGEQGVWTFVVWSEDPVWSAGPEAIPANQASVDALRDGEPEPAYDPILNDDGIAY